MNVLYSFPLRFGMTGTGNLAWQMVNALARQGVDVYLSCGSCERQVDVTAIKQTLVRHGIKLPIKLLGIDYAAALHDRITASWLEKLAAGVRIDVVHCWPVGAQETLKTARRLGIKTAVERPNTHTGHAYRVVQQECSRLGVKLEKGHSHKQNERRLKRELQEYDLADLLLCPSRQVKDSFVKEGFGDEKLAIHQYGFDPGVFSEPLRDTRVKSDIFRVAFVGSGEPRKGLHYALDAWLGSKASNHGILYICGTILDGYREMLAEKLAHPSVRQLGRTGNVAEIMQKSHALILPSIEEGSALVTYEARACGAVLLVSDACGARCIHMHDSLVHKVGDTKALTEHIDKLYSNRELFSRLQDNSLAGANELTWEKAGQILAGVYEDLLNGKTDSDGRKTAGQFAL
ncbi:MAG: glycosyltransferase family 4 protein [Phycisphaerae bacterium]